jgi:cyclopropane fatty-acyl-phospholipid synthase-like methyltransferase
LVSSDPSGLGQRRGAQYEMMTERITEFDFDETFGEEYYYFYEQSLIAERTEREADAIWKLVALKPGSTVLDLGCGHGRISNALTERGARVTGLYRGRQWVS